MLSFFKTYYQKILRNGIDAKSLAFSVSLSLLLTTFPIYGLTTVVLTSLAIKYKLNLPLTLAISYSMEPLRFLLFIPFIHTTENLLGLENTMININELTHTFKEGFLMNIQLLGILFSKAILGWLFIAIPSSITFYYLNLNVFSRISIKRKVLATS